MIRGSLLLMQALQAALLFSIIADGVCRHLHYFKVQTTVLPCMITYMDHGVTLSQEQRDTSIILLLTPWSLQQTGKQINNISVNDK